MSWESPEKFGGLCWEYQANLLFYWDGQQMGWESLVVPLKTWLHCHNAKLISHGNPAFPHRTMILWQYGKPRCPIHNIANLRGHWFGVEP